MRGPLLLVLVVALCMAGPQYANASATPYRYATTSWVKPSPSSAPFDVRVTLVMGWQHSYFNDLAQGCHTPEAPDINTCSDGGLPGVGDVLTVKPLVVDGVTTKVIFSDTSDEADKLTVNESPSIGFAMTVKSVDLDQDFLIGVATFDLTYEKSGWFAFAFQGCCRMGAPSTQAGLVNNMGGAWSVKTMVYAGAGGVSKSPVISHLPITAVPDQFGTTTFTVNGVDPEGSTLQFFMGSATEHSGDALKAVPTENLPYSGRFEGVNVNGEGVVSITANAKSSALGLSSTFGAFTYIMLVLRARPVASEANVYVDLLVKIQASCPSPPCSCTVASPAPCNVPPIVTAPTTESQFYCGFPNSLVVNASDAYGGAVVQLTSPYPYFAYTTPPTFSPYIHGGSVGAVLNWLPSCNDAGRVAVALFVAKDTGVPNFVSTPTAAYVRLREPTPPYWAGETCGVAAGTPPVESAGCCRFTVAVGDTLEVQLVAEDDDPNDAVQIYVLEDPGLPNGATTGPSEAFVRPGVGGRGMQLVSRSLTWTPMAWQSGRVYNVTWQAFDRFDRSSNLRCTELEVTSSTVSYAAPLLQHGKNKKAHVNCLTEIAVHATDTRYDTAVDVTTLASQLPAGSTVSSTSDGHKTTTIFRWTPVRGMEGQTHTVCFRGRDVYNMTKLPELCAHITVERCSYCPRSGETLHYVATAFGHDTNWLRLWNYNPNVADPDLLLTAGSPITIGSVYTVQVGDTLSAIASRLRTTVKKILEVNPDIDINQGVLPGQDVCVMPCTVSPPEKVASAYNPPNV